MASSKFFIVDQDYRARNSLAQALQSRGSVVQLDRVEEIGSLEDRETFVFIADRDGTLLEECAKLDDCGTFCFIVAYHEAPSLARVVECLSGPLNGYLHWPGDEKELDETLKALSNSATVQVRQRISQSKARQKLGLLSPRELQVARGVAAGLSSKELAPALGVSYRTVEFHRANVMDKLGARNIASVIRTVIEAGESYDESQFRLNNAA